MYSRLGCGALINTVETQYKGINQALTSSYSIPSKNDVQYNYISLDVGTYDMLYIDSDPDITFKGEEIYNGLPSEWGTGTIFFANFNGDLNAGNLDFSVDNLNYILVMRRETTGSDNLAYDPVDIISVEEFLQDEGATIIDRLVQCNKEYDYKAIPVLLNGTEASSLNAKYDTDKRVKWQGHYIFDGESEWHCDINPTLQWTRNKLSSVVNPTNGKFPYMVSFCQNNYDTISITGNHFKVDCTYPDNFDLDATAEYNQSYDDFISSNRPKLIRDWSGRMWIAKLNGNIEHMVNGHHNNISTSHEFVEIADYKDSDVLYKYGFSNYNPAIMTNGNIAEEVKFGTTIQITVINKNGDICSGRDITLLLNSVEIWNCTTNSTGTATINNLDAGLYTIIVGTGLYATKKQISINSSSPDTIPITVKVGV